ncbi:hypothetical protein CAI21_12330 [Alkalilimnicola ehrlichii]|uniref:Uncharacterized protein n=1 Tax=Alkalilimnicola ehrlichii TaxID=351052 RepID=A0A3E0X1H3_9GAMM|nr:hypothetical protein CAI21_12330 [Alkalilimnicola ehrlichii]RFA38576.1 hypothetical protein CAL65_04330 [Alkalilimnicola ehrlichii]
MNSYRQVQNIIIERAIRPVRSHSIWLRWRGSVRARVRRKAAVPSPSRRIRIRPDIGHQYT